jgi:hypothetical protein
VSFALGLFATFAALLLLEMIRQGSGR